METIPFPIINDLIMWGVLATQVVIVPLAILAFGPVRWTPAWLSRHALVLAFLLVLGSFVGSLYYSSIAGFAPCVLCWYQRIFIVAQIVVLGVAIYRGEGKTALPYALSLALVGGVIALYHNFLPFFEESYICAPGEVSCLAEYVTGFGYIDIPMMSLTVFVALLLLYRLASRKML